MQTLQDLPNCVCSRTQHCWGVNGIVFMSEYRTCSATKHTSFFLCRFWDAINAINACGEWL